jgi:hypothetical protein
MQHPTQVIIASPYASVTSAQRWITCPRTLEPSAETARVSPSNQCVEIKKTFVTVTHTVAPVIQKSIRVKPKYTNITEKDVWTKN